MTCAFIWRFGFFQISGFLNPGNLLAEHLAKNQCAGRDQFFSHTVPTEIYQHNPSDFVQFCQTPEHSLQETAMHSIHNYEVRPRKDRRGIDLISDALPFGRLI